MPPTDKRASHPIRRTALELAYEAALMDAGLTGCGFTVELRFARPPFLLDPPGFVPLTPRTRAFPSWRFDFAWTDVLLAVEVQGGIYRAGKHTTVTGIRTDIAKLNTAVLLGWDVLQVHGDMVRDGSAVAAVAEWFDAYEHIPIRDRRYYRHIPIRDRPNLRDLLRGGVA